MSKGNSRATPDVILGYGRYLLIINLLRESDRNGESLWGKRQGEAVTEIVEGHQQAVMAAGAVCLVSPGYRETECRVP
jgi:hypothetical protein